VQGKSTRPVTSADLVQEVRCLLNVALGRQVPPNVAARPVQGAPMPVSGRKWPRWGPHQRKSGLRGDVQAPPGGETRRSGATWRTLVTRARWNVSPRDQRCGLCVVERCHERRDPSADVQPGSRLDGEPRRGISPHAPCRAAADPVTDPRGGQGPPVTGTGRPRRKGSAQRCATCAGGIKYFGTGVLIR